MRAVMPQPSPYRRPSSAHDKVDGRSAHQEVRGRGSDFVYALACTPDGVTLASGNGDDTVCLWRLAETQTVDSFM